jgi:hypothetical protein
MRKKAAITVNSKDTPSVPSRSELKDTLESFKCGAAQINDCNCLIKAFALNDEFRTPDISRSVTLLERYKSRLFTKDSAEKGNMKFNQ